MAPTRPRLLFAALETVVGVATVVCATTAVSGALPAFIVGFAGGYLGIAGVICRAQWALGDA